jgi:hypothetical protein
MRWGKDPKSNREKDVFTQSFENKEHPSRTRGAGLIPCNVEFEAKSSSYRSHSRARAKWELEYNRWLREIEEKFEQWLNMTIEAQV